jgi:hypothetical protein
MTLVKSSRWQSFLPSGTPEKVVWAIGHQGEVVGHELPAAVLFAVGGLAGMVAELKFRTPQVGVEEAMAVRLSSAVAAL